jgi:hypothetical protein
MLRGMDNVRSTPAVDRGLVAAWVGIALVPFSAPARSGGRRIRSRNDMSSLVKTTVRRVQSVLRAAYQFTARLLQKAVDKKMMLPTRCSELSSGKQADAICRQVIDFIGGRTRTRTLDPLIKSQPISQRR